MSSHEIDRAVARATGESVRVIKQLGFSLLAQHPARLDDESNDACPQIVNWDDVQAERIALAIQA